MLFDTDVLIWHLRGNAPADHIIKNDPSPCISAVSYMEVTQGLFNKEESRRWKAFLSNFNINILPINEAISTKAMFWMENFSLSHGLDIPDALIAATADKHLLTLVTGNTKDYRYLPGLNIKAFKE